MAYCSLRVLFPHGVMRVVYTVGCLLDHTIRWGDLSAREFVSRDLICLARERWISHGACFDINAIFWPNGGFQISNGVAGNKMAYL